jgi:hypothetical protein
VIVKIEFIVVQAIFTSLLLRSSHGVNETVVDEVKEAGHQQREKKKNSKTHLQPQIRGAGCMSNLSTDPHPGCLSCNSSKLFCGEKKTDPILPGVHLCLRE